MVFNKFYFNSFPASYSKTCVKRPLSKRQKIGFQDQLLLNAGHSAILSTFIKLPFAFKTFVLSTFEWLFYTGFTVVCLCSPQVA